MPHCYRQKERLAATYRGRNSTGKPADLFKVFSPCTFSGFTTLN